MAPSLAIACGLLGLAVSMLQGMATDCVDTHGSATDSYQDGCEAYTTDPYYCQDAAAHYDDQDFTAAEMCCACGGGNRCEDTSGSATGRLGRGCDYFTSHPWMCASQSAYVDEDFTPAEMCCACGGGTAADFDAPTTTTTTACEDTDGSATDNFGTGCEQYTSMPVLCGSEAVGLNSDNGDFTAMEMCCACGGGSRSAPDTTTGATTTCEDTSGSAHGRNGFSCDIFTSFPFMCDAQTSYDDEDFTSAEMCCACGGGTTTDPDAPTTTTVVHHHWTTTTDPDAPTTTTVVHHHWTTTTDEDDDWTTTTDEDDDRTTTTDEDDDWTTTTDEYDDRTTTTDEYDDRTTTTDPDAPSTTIEKPGASPGDEVEVRCASDGNYGYHPARVHSVSSDGIVVVYKHVGHVYFCAPKQWRLPSGLQPKPCKKHWGILPPWGGYKCCPKSCGVCGMQDCHKRPGGSGKCCTRRIPDSKVCGVNKNKAPCSLMPRLPEDVTPMKRRLRGLDITEGDRAETPFWVKEAMDVAPATFSSAPTDDDPEPAAPMTVQTVA